MLNPYLNNLCVFGVEIFSLKADTALLSLCSTAFPFPLFTHHFFRHTAEKHFTSAAAIHRRRLPQISLSVNIRTVIGSFTVI
jgi:hypothetical protein